MSIKRILATLSGGVAIAIIPSLSAVAAGTVVVTPANTQGWYIADQRTGATVSYVTDATSPMPTGALQLTTTSDNNSKIQYMHDTSTPISGVSNLKYSTKQLTGPLVADPSYQLAMCLGGATATSCTGYTTMVYEPYWNGTVVAGSWQPWNVDSGSFWSSSSYSAGTCQITKAPGGPPSYTLAQLKTLCPSATVVSFGVDVGTYNPNYVVRTDGVTFNDTVYNFEQTNVPTAKDQCKKDGYKNVTDANGNSFKNQGQCVSFVNHNHGDKDHNDKDKNDNHQDGESND